MEVQGQPGQVSRILSEQAGELERWLKQLRARTVGLRSQQPHQPLRTMRPLEHLYSHAQTHTVTRVHRIKLKKL